MNNETIASLLKCIAHPVKISILSLLQREESLSVSEIQMMLGCDCEQSMLSHHLIKMKDKGVLKSIKQGKKIYYTLQLKEIAGILPILESLESKS
jgi:DNA-binding transcriptional ArsR family regulator